MLSPSWYLTFIKLFEMTKNRSFVFSVIKYLKLKPEAAVSIDYKRLSQFQTKFRQGVRSSSLIEKIN